MRQKRKRTSDDAADGASLGGFPYHFAEHVAPRLQDVLPIIFAYVGPDFKTLRSAMRVCHGWADAAGDVVWLRSSAASLLRVPAGRRQMYANKIQQLHVVAHRNVPDLEPIESLFFPRLRRIHLGDAALFGRLVSGRLRHVESADAAAPPFWPRLELLACCDTGLLNPAVHSLLEREPPPLRELVVTSKWVPRAEQPPPLLVSALQHCGPDTLEKATFRGPVGVAANVVAHLAGRRGLKHVEISEDSVSAAAVQDAFAQCAGNGRPPFADIETIEVWADWDAVALIAQSGLPAARELVAHVLDARGVLRVRDVRLSAVAAVVQLRLLHVILHDNDSITASDIIPALRSLSQLCDLTVASRDDRLKIDGFGDAELASLLSATPLLEVLSLEGDCDMTPAAIRIAGELCRHLRWLGLHQRLDLDLLPSAETSTTTLFPELRRLRLTSPRSNEKYWIRTWAPDLSL